MRSPQHVWCLIGGFLVQALSDVHLNKSTGVQAKLSHQIQDPLHTFFLGIFYTLVPPDLGLEHAGSISIIAPTQWRHLSWVRSVHGCIAFRKLHRWHLESFRYMGTMNLSVSHFNPVYNDSQIHPWATLKRSKQWGCLCSLQHSFPSSSPGSRVFDPLLSSLGQGAYGRKGSYGEKFAATLYSSICSLSHMASTPRCCWPSTERLVAKVGPCSKGSGCVLHKLCVLSTFRFKTLHTNGNSTWFP